MARHRMSIQAHIVSIQYRLNTMDLGESISCHPALFCNLQHLSAQSCLYSQCPEWRWIQRRYSAVFEQICLHSASRRIRERLRVCSCCSFLRVADRACQLWEEIFVCCTIVLQSKIESSFCSLVHQLQFQSESPCLGNSL